MNWKWFWRILAVVAVAVFVPSFFTAAWQTTCEVASGAADVAHEGYAEATDAPAPYTGPIHVERIRIRLDVNPRHRGWGQALASRSQLPEISGRVYAARMVSGQPRIELHESGLPTQVRMNQLSPLRMEWAGVRVVLPRYSLPVGVRGGWWLCVELHESLEGFNLLGPPLDGLRLLGISAHGDQSVAEECKELSNLSYPRNSGLITLTRQGESVPMGHLTVLFEGLR
jgi:hypothetical protein